MSAEFILQRRAPLDQLLFKAKKVREHYDFLSHLYKKYWGNHIHHGYWQNGESVERAQIQLMEKLAAFARIPRGAEVLDVGSGIGGPALWLAREFGCQVTGISISPEQVKMAGSLIAKNNLQDSVEFMRMDANHLEFDDGSFDVIWVIECSEHLRDKKKFFQKCHALLRPGGTLALCSWLAGDPIQSDRHRQVIEDICRGMLCPSFLTMEGTRQAIKSAGFEVDSVNVTREVEKTWDYVLGLSSFSVWADAWRNFTVAWPFLTTVKKMKQAYAEGTMAYGMFRGKK